MIISMTGFGRAEKQNDQLVITVEVKTINSRFLDFSPRFPKMLSPFEDEANKLVKEKCTRGRVSITANFEFLTGGGNGISLNPDRLSEFLDIIKDIQSQTGQNELPSIGDLLKLPEVIKSGDDYAPEDVKPVFFQALNEALSGVETIRQQEGDNIKKDLEMRLNIIENTVEKIGVITENSKQDNYYKYKSKIQELAADINLDEGRLCQELAIIVEKRDITEELVRLHSHIKLFKQYFTSDAHVGKKMNFVLQEMGREINTVGSKTDIVEVNHLVVNLKDELEKMREQVQNII